MSIKPKFDVSTRATSVPLHWFRLKKNESQTLSLKRACFGVGESFRDAGFAVPDSCLGKLCALVFVKDEGARQSTLDGDWTWQIALMTQAFVGEVYLRFLKGGKRTPKKDYLETAEEFDWAKEFDDITADIGLSISHSEDPTNKGRTVYKLLEE